LTLSTSKQEVPLTITADSASKEAVSLNRAESLKISTGKRAVLFSTAADLTVLLLLIIQSLVRSGNRRGVFFNLSAHLVSKKAVSLSTAGRLMIPISRISFSLAADLTLSPPLVV
jgi:hypothetical protein